MKAGRGSVGWARSTDGLDGRRARDGHAANRRGAILGLGLALLAGTASVCSAVSLTLTSLERWPAGAGARAVTLADVDGDSDLDAIVANGASGMLTVILNDDTGRFPTREEWALGGTPVDVAAADFNLDGDPDLVAADSTASRAVVLLGGPGAAFSAPARYHTGTGPCAIAIGPGFYGVAPGFVTANAGAASISAFESNGSGVPVDRTDGAVGAIPNDVAAIDYDYDGFGDVVVSTPHGVVLLDGEYEFYDRYFYFTRDSLATPDGAHGVLITDLGASGWNDLVAATGAGNGTLSAWPGDGQTPFGPRADVAVAIGPGPLASADFDGDGDFDVAAASPLSGEIAVLLNENGVLTVDQVVAAGEPIAGLAAGDVDDNGLADLVAALPGSGRIAVLRSGAVLAAGVRSVERLALAAIPNPARGRRTALRFAVPGGASARLRVTDVAGRLYLARDLPSGVRELAWDAAGARAPAGVYFATLEAAGQRVTRRIVIAE